MAFIDEEIDAKASRISKGELPAHEYVLQEDPKAEELATLLMAMWGKAGYASLDRSERYLEKALEIRLVRDQIRAEENLAWVGWWVTGAVGLATLVMAFA